jgi:hypothetical protein
MSRVSAEPIVVADGARVGDTYPKSPRALPVLTTAEIIGIHAQRSTATAKPISVNIRRHTLTRRSSSGETCRSQGSKQTAADKRNERL